MYAYVWFVILQVFDATMQMLAGGYIQMAVDATSYRICEL